MSKYYDINSIKPRLTEYVNMCTNKSQGKLYVCPICGSGTKSNRTGAFSIMDNKIKWKCFSCNKHGDIFDLYGYINNETVFKKQLDGIRRELNI